MLQRRALNWLGFAVCVALLAYAYYAQFQLQLEPCPLCVFQRVGIALLALLFLLAALQHPLAVGARVYAVLIDLAALATLAVAIRHLYIQHLPAGSVPSCGASLEFMWKIFSPADVIRKVLGGSGECAKVSWRFLTLSMPAWVAIAAIGLSALGLYANLLADRRRPERV